MTVRITNIHEAENLTMIKVEGKLSAADAVMLTWVLARLEAGESVSIDMSGVTFIDGEGAAIFGQLEQNGASLIGADFFIRTVIDGYSNGNR